MQVCLHRLTASLIVQVIARLYWLRLETSSSWPPIIAQTNRLKGPLEAP